MIVHILPLTGDEEKFYSTLNIADQLAAEGDNQQALLCINASEHEAVLAENYELASEFRDLKKRYTA
jgi:hypothetical protein